MTDPGDALAQRLTEDNPDIFLPGCGCGELRHEAAAALSAARAEALDEAAQIVRDFGFVTNHEARDKLIAAIRVLKDKP